MAVPDPCCVGVFGLPSSTTLDDITRVFSAAGHVVKRFMLMDRTVDEDGVFKNYAFVTFLTKEEAEEAVKTLHGTRDRFDAGRAIHQFNGLKIRGRFVRAQYCH